MTSAAEVPLLDAPAAGDAGRGRRRTLAAGLALACGLLAAAAVGLAQGPLSLRAASQLLAAPGKNRCGSGPKVLSAHGDDTPRRLEIISGPDPPPRGDDWVAWLCGPSHETNCSNATTWSGKVDVCLDGELIKGVNMKTRGHVSAWFPKHQFNLKLHHKKSLLGMGKAERWVLATSFIDTSFQRNPFAFDLYRGLGGWATQTRYVELFWHGTFYGLYYIGEKIEPSKHRLDVPKAHKHHPKKSGYLAAVDWPKADKDHVSSIITNTTFNVYYPKGKDFTEKHKAYLQGFVDNLDILLKSANASVKNVVDFESMARLYIVQELAKDIDGYCFSNFVMVKKGRLYHAAPWDFDLAYGWDCTRLYCRNAFTDPGLPADFVPHSFGNMTCGIGSWNVENLRDSMYWVGDNGGPGPAFQFLDHNKRQLFLNLWMHREFVEYFATTWVSARKSLLSDASLMAMVGNRAKAIEAAAERDVAIWKDSERSCAFWNCCHEKDGQSFASSTDHFLFYLLDRAAWIDANIGDLVRSRASEL